MNEDDVEEGTGDAESVGPEDGVATAEEQAVSSPAIRRPGHRWLSWRPMAFGLVVIAAMSALVGWLGVQSAEYRQADQQAARFLQAARQAAVNLTTVDWQRADEDVKRIMDGAAGEFYDDFAQRAQPFVDVVKQAQSVSVGTVTEAGLESQSTSEAQALVAVSVKTSNTTGEEPVPRAWRMRISVQQVDNQMKISRVEFVP
ncbi:mammalian cell entry protein [Mycolicibacterium peregrinum]|nr:mammalian cell entry protein [Mycolicibacterium peregrinum]